MRAKATKAKAAKSMDKRAERLAAGLADVRVQDKVAKLRFPTPVAVRQDAAVRRGPVQELRLAGDLHRRRPRGGPGHPRRRPRAQRRREDDAAADAGRHRDARHRRGQGRARAARGLLRPGARDDRHGPHRCSRSCSRRRRTAPPPSCAGSSARSSSPARPSTSGPARSPAASGPGWPWPRSSSRVPTCCCSTSRPTTSTRPAASRCSRRCAPTPGAIVLVTHDEGAVHALNPDKVILLPDGTEDSLERGLRRPGLAGLSRPSELAGHWADAGPGRVSAACPRGRTPAAG